MSVLKTYSLAEKTDELKKLILENPDLPIVVLAGENANDGYFGWMYCSSISFGIGEILDYDFYDYDDTVFTDRERFEEKIEDDLWEKYYEKSKWEKHYEKSKEEYDTAVKKEIEKYEPYWTKVIVIWVDN